VGVGKFSKFVRNEVGEGSTVWFWHDLWCGEQPLKFSFPELFTIAHCKDVWMRIVCNSGMETFMNIFFTKPVHD